MGIGAMGLLFYFLSGGAHSNLMLMACAAISVTGIAGILVGWFHEPSE